jgi:hypothetical protein
MSQSPSNPVETPEPAKPQDLLDYLLQKWRDDYPNDVMANSEAVLAVFINHSREVLKKNQPIGTDNLNGVLALRFQDFTSLPLVYIPEEETRGMTNPGPAINIGQSRGGGTMPTRSWGVGGK